MIKLVNVAISVGQNNRTGVGIRAAVTWDINGLVQTNQYEMDDLKLDVNQISKLQSVIDALTTAVVNKAKAEMSIDPSVI